MTRAQYQKWRFYAESLIQQAIDILDALDGDADLEDGGEFEPDGHEEPSINPVEPWFRPAPAASRAAA
ncbi:hypothetical protein [Microvirga lotononidis]|uniref:Uncharacterized protein n=1 Tax=Microvirga lotononidis TaxID=864069 RepID=I4YRU2_9HYPH|nr:hypothetical protein [Microvirga lotononidis]EIM26684.1 hypothetical protein MicloDRAFT_00032340 [Microvirga lotononidis]WQO32086.1 hypothetical protein U0023_35390 [Microvirga lotononidis]